MYPLPGGQGWVHFRQQTTKWPRDAYAIGRSLLCGAATLFNRKVHKGNAKNRKGFAPLCELLCVLCDSYFDE